MAKQEPSGKQLLVSGVCGRPSHLKAEKGGEATKGI